MVCDYRTWSVAGTGWEGAEAGSRGVLEGGGVWGVGRIGSGREGQNNSGHTAGGAVCP